MFRSRFNEVMPAKLSNLGPQDIERGVVDTTPSPEVSHLLCAMLGLALNRKKPPEYVYPFCITRQPTFRCRHTRTR